jgi:hypothetical protein
MLRRRRNWSIGVVARSCTVRAGACVSNCRDDWTIEVCAVAGALNGLPPRVGATLPRGRFRTQVLLERAATFRTQVPRIPRGAFEKSAQVLAPGDARRATCVARAGRRRSALEGWICNPSRPTGRDHQPGRTTSPSYGECRGGRFERRSPYSQGRVIARRRGASRHTRPPHGCNSGQAYRYSPVGAIRRADDPRRRGGADLLAPPVTPCPPWFTNPQPVQSAPPAAEGPRALP